MKKETQLVVEREIEEESIYGYEEEWWKKEYEKEK